MCAVSQDGLQQRFTEWCAELKLQLVEGKDYRVFQEKSKTPQGGRPSTDYMLTADTVKIISMWGKSAFGDTVRRYFVEAERTDIGATSKLTKTGVVPSSAARYG